MSGINMDIYRKCLSDLELKGILKVWDCQGLFYLPLRQSAQEGSPHRGKQSSDMERKEIFEHLDPAMPESLGWSFIE